jgi:hypothetical protein
MRIVEESWKVLVTLLPTGWHQLAWQSGANRQKAGQDGKPMEDSVQHQAAEFGM